MRLLVALTVLPLSYRDPRTFRRTCQTVGGVLLGLEIVVSVPFLLLVLPFLVAFLPAGVVLMPAGWKRGGPVRNGLAAVLAACPFAVAAGMFCHAH